MPNPKPFVQVACVCEKVLIEPDNVASLIRIVDTYTLEPVAVPFLTNMPLPPLPPPTIDLSAFISLKSGDVLGEFEVGLRLIRPGNKAGDIRKWPVIFNGAEHGVNLKISFKLTNPTIGLHWFDVLWGDEVLTRIPFRLKSTAPEESTDDQAGPNESATR